MKTFLLFFTLFIWHSLGAENRDSITSYQLRVTSINRDSAETEIEILFKKDSTLKKEKVLHLGVFHSIQIEYFKSRSIVIIVNYEEYSDIFIYKSNGVSLPSIPSGSFKMSSNKFYLEIGMSRFVFDSLKYHLEEYYKFYESRLEYFNCWTNDAFDIQHNTDAFMPEAWYPDNSVKNCSVKNGQYLYYYSYLPNGKLHSIDIYEDLSDSKFLNYVYITTLKL